MDVFDLRGNLVTDYRDYVRSFIKIRDPRIERFVDGILDAAGFWPEPLLQLNPTFRPGGTIEDLVDEGTLHPECSRIFRIDKSGTDHRGRQLLLHQHQRDAIRKAKEGRSYVLTTGTGFGKSLAYIVPIVDHVLRNGSGRGIQAIVVYPMNALANSQNEELGKFIDRGYHLVTAYRFPEVNGRLDRKDAAAFCDGKHVLTLSYADATDLYRVNLGWAHQDERAPKGFNLDIERGYWSRNQADTADQDDAASEARVMRAVPFVRDTKNALVMRFEPARSGPETASLQAAFKQAIQRQFQLEPRELACEPMPSRGERLEIFFHKVSEGGAGVLRRLVEDPKVLPALARRALAICHYDPDTLEDRAADRCGRACYECLLDYGNQPDHKDVNRELIRDFLADLARAECRPAGGAGWRAERLAALRKRCDSRLEERWLDQVDTLGLRLPSDAQYRIPGYPAQPDFFYRDANAAIYVDGPPHDAPHQIREDEAATRALMQMGYIVLRFHHDADWLAIFRRHQDVFGALGE